MRDRLLHTKRPAQRAWVFALALGLVAAVASPVRAQVRTGTLYGTVKDSSGAVVPGVSLTVSSPQLIKGQEDTATDDAGQWRVASLPPGVYTVTAAMSGFATVKQERIVLEAGNQIRVDLELSLSTVEESLTVTAESPVVDVRSAELTHTVAQELIHDIPIERNYAAVITTMPGVTDGGRYTYALTQTVHGSGVRDNDYMIDGQSSKHPSGYSGTDISIEALDAVQVTTGGISAEFGQASGGVITFVTKSGGDQFRGTGYYYFVDDGLQSTNVSSEQAARGVPTEAGIVRDTNWGANFGGPIIKSRLWFFADINRGTNETIEAGFPDASVRQRLGSGANVSDDRWLYFVKATYQVSTNNRFFFAFNHQRRIMLPSNPGAEYRIDERAWRKQYWLPKVYNAQWTSVLGDNAVFEAQIGKLKVIEDNTFPYGSFDPSEVNGYQDTGSGVNYGTWDRARGRFDGRDHWDIHANLSYFASNVLGGSHEIKTGLHRQQLWEQRWNVIPNNLLMRLNSPRTCLSLDCGVPRDVTLYDWPYDSQSAAVIYAAYVQDQWSLPKGLTLNLGLRFENSNGWLPEQRSGADLEPNGFDPDLDGVTTDFPTIAWFPSKVWPERKDIITWNNLSPRIGVSWDPSGTSRFVVKGTYGRWYDRLATQIVGTGDPAGGNARYDWLDCRNASGTPILCTGLPAAQVNGDLYFTPEERGRLLSTSVVDPSEVTNVGGIDPNVDQPYADAFNIGFEIGINPNLSFGVAGIYKKLGNILGTIDPTRRPFGANFDPVQVTNPVTGDAMTIYLEKVPLGSVPTQSLLTNPPEAESKYRGIEFILRKRYSDRWQFYGSYVYGRSEGNVGTHYNDGIGFNVRTPNALINAYGPVSLDSTHQIKLNGSYLAPFDINVAISYLGLTGYPITPLISEIGGAFGGATYFQFRRGIDYPARDAAGQAYRESALTIPVEPRGANRVDFRSVLNVRVEKSFALGQGRRLGVLLDVLNLFNSNAVTHVQTQRIDFVNFGRPAAIETPRRARLGIRVDF